MTRHATAMGLVGAAGLCVSSASAQFTLEKIITNTDPVPTLPTLQWQQISHPAQNGAFTTGASIDQNGNVAFQGVLYTDGHIVDFSNQYLGLYGTPGNLQYLFRKKDQAPGLPAGWLMGGFQVNTIPQSRTNGVLLIGGQSSYPASPTTPGGFIATGPFGGVAKVALNGDTMPGGNVLDSSPGSTTPNSLNVNSNGQVCILGQTGPQATPILAFYVGGPGTLQLVCKEGPHYPSLPSGGYFDTDHTSAGGGMGMLLHNGQGNLVGSGIMHADNINITALNNELLFTWRFGSGEGALNIIAREGDPAPGCGGATYLAQSANGTGAAFNFQMWKGNFNDQGHVLFGDGLQGAGVTSGVNDFAVWYYDGAGVHLFRRLGDPTTAVPGATLSYVNSGHPEYDAGMMRLNNSDTVVRVARLTAGVAGVTAANDSVLLRTTLGSSTDMLLAREGSPVTDPASGRVVIPGALWGDVFEVNGSYFQQNNAGQVLFIASLTDDGSGTTFAGYNDHALMAWDPVQGMMLVYRTGTDLSNLVGFQPDAIFLGVGTRANAEGGSNALADNGWFAFGVSANIASSPNSAILRTRFPAPACYANCDGSTTPPVLNVGDFTCFLQKFAAGDPYANCDQSTTPPVLNVGDFTCFLQKYAAGCP
jgi:hypothetical protein